MKHFITGIFGTGKSTLAKRISEEKKIPLVNFDSLFPSVAPFTVERVEKFLANLPENFVTDAIPFDPTWTTFNNWVDETVQVTCVGCTEQEWQRRNAARPNPHPTGHELWSGFWLGRLHEGRFPCTFYDSETSEYVTRAQMYEKVGYAKMLMEHLEASPKGYDWKYQDIEEIGFVGYAGCKKSWEQIQPLADWKGSSVVDLGSNHCYMLFRAEDAGATSILGLDQSEAVLITATYINCFRGGKLEVSLWTSSQPIPAADITICRNVLHHFQDPAGVLSQIQSPLTIIEVAEKGDTGIDFVAAMNAEFKTVERFDSHQVNRSIYRCFR